jgi:BASS family bile acid:Na+ symporter
MRLAGRLALLESRMAIESSLLEQTPWKQVDIVVGTPSLITLLNVTALETIMLSMGLQVKFEDVLDSARPARLLVLGLLANYGIVPMVTLGLLWLFQANPMVSVGFFILAVCPGAPLGPPLTAIARGNVPWAIGIMVILAGLSAFLSPALLGASLARLASDGDLHVDYPVIVRTLLITQMLPLALGLGIHHRAPGLTRWIAKPVNGLANVLLLALVGLIVATQYQTLAAIRPRAWMGMSLLLLASLGIGWLCGGPELATRKAMAVTTATRNAAVGLVIATGNFANTPAVTAVVAYGLISTVAALGVALLFGKFAPIEPKTAHAGSSH